MSSSTINKQNNIFYSPTVALLSLDAFQAFSSQIFFYAGFQNIHSRKKYDQYNREIGLMNKMMFARRHFRCQSLYFISTEE